ncbi:hypothetical protein P4S52_13210 [Vibrio sp. SA48]|uniref:hypothetical protein n=1 Tax=Vibrio sp. S12_S33 TaxID=2720223 RepID=UPI00177AC6A1|nr:hypothetical protein [Vibrio sp. S12_S33]MBD1564300.1 hypothetical protein [Vibrio sp. S12_S33]
MTEAYDEKNQDDYERNTKLLIEKIDEIERNKNLSPTITQLAELTGIHRNTISAREFPKVRLKEIKKNRLEKKKAEQKEKIPTQKKILEDSLDNAQKELVYWFQKCSALDTSNKQLQKNLDKMSESRKVYEQMLSEERQKVVALKAELNQIKNVLN